MISRLWKRKKKPKTLRYVVLDEKQADRSETAPLHPPAEEQAVQPPQPETDTITYSIQGGVEWSGWANLNYCDDTLQASKCLDDLTDDDDIEDAFEDMEELIGSLQVPGAEDTSNFIFHETNNSNSNTGTNWTSKLPTPRQIPARRKIHTYKPPAQTLRMMTLHYWFLVAEDEQALRAFHNSADRRIEAISRASGCKIAVSDTCPDGTKIVDRSRKKITVQIDAPDGQALRKCCAILDEKFPRFYASGWLADRAHLRIE